MESTRQAAATVFVKHDTELMDTQPLLVRTTRANADASIAKRRTRHTATSATENDVMPTYLSTMPEPVPAPEPALAARIASTPLSNTDFSIWDISSQVPSANSTPPALVTSFFAVALVSDSTGTVNGFEKATLILRGGTSKTFLAKATPGRFLATSFWPI